MTGANGEVSFINIKTLNEWDSRVSAPQPVSLFIPCRVTRNSLPVVPFLSMASHFRFTLWTVGSSHSLPTLFFVLATISIE